MNNFYRCQEEGEALGEAPEVDPGEDPGEAGGEPDLLQHLP